MIYKKLKWNTLFNISLLSIFFMYIEIFHGFETQPFFITGISIIYLLYSIKIKNYDNLIFIYFSFILLILYAYMLSYLIYPSNIIDMIKYIVGPTIFFAYFYSPFFLRKSFFQYLQYILYIIMLYYSLILLKIPFIANLIIYTEKIFIPRFEIYNNSRGFGFLTPEPSYFAITLIFFFILIDLSKIDNKFTIGQFLILLFMLLNKSATGLLLIFIYLFISRVSLSIKKLLILILSLLFIIYILSLYPNRIFQIYLELLKNDNVNLLNVLLYSLPSFGSRIIINIIGVFSIILYPFGIGFGHFSESWIIISNYINIDIFLNPILKNLYIANQKVSAQAYIPNLIASIGWFGLPIYYLIFKIITRVKLLNKKYLAVCIIILYLLLIQSQATNPIPWILLAIVYKKIYGKVVFENFKYN